MMRGRQPILRQTVLITGATDGIGLALARRYAAQKARLILVGRRSLEELDPDFFTKDRYCRIDLSALNAESRLMTWLRARKIEQIDLLIQNAGVGYVGPVAEQPDANIRQLVAVNLRAPIALTHALLPLMNREAGKIVFIGSVASTLPMADYAVYVATKAALSGFVRSLQIELAASVAYGSIALQMIHPGATQTGMHAKSGADPAEMTWEKFPPAAKVAAQIERAICQKRRSRVLGFVNSLVYRGGKYLPRLVDAAMHQNARRKATPPTRKETGAGKHCMITGAADGIGKALALRYAAAGYAITGIDFDAARVEQTEAEIAALGGDVAFLIADLADAAALQRLEEALALRPAIDLLIHNAGINAVGHFAQMDLPRQETVLAVNFTAPLLLTSALLRMEKLAADGSVLFVSSLSHFVSYPSAAVYAASKDGLAQYARALYVALATRNINVLTIFPGPTRTAHARRYSPDNSRENRRMAPAVLAERIFQAEEQRKRVLIPGFGNRLFALGGRLFPRAAEWAMRRALLDKVEGK